LGKIYAMAAMLTEHQKRAFLESSLSPLSQKQLKISS